MESVPRGPADGADELSAAEALGRLVHVVHRCVGRDGAVELDVVAEALVRVTSAPLAVVVADADRAAHGELASDPTVVEAVCAAVAADHEQYVSPDLGTVHLLARPVDPDGDRVVVLARPGSAFDRGAVAVADAVARTLVVVFALADRLEEQRRLTEEARRLVGVDALTGLPDRTRVLEELDRIQRSGDEVTVLFVDLDRFKAVNDTVGHAAGDLVLQTVARRLVATVSSTAFVGRLSGDEFIVLCPDTGEHAAVVLGQRIISALAEPVRGDGREYRVTASVGVARTGAADEAPAELLGNADVAMYRAKQRGRGRLEVFDRTMRSRIVADVELSAGLKRALVSDELDIHYQPIVTAGDRRVIAVEALVRWNHPERGLLLASEFMPIAEENQLVEEIDRWVLGRACDHMATWIAGGHHDLLLSLNLSSRHFTDPGLAQSIARVLMRTALEPGNLWLEITETILMEDAELTLRTLEGLRRLGVRLAVDDFGTGYSSIGYLRRFPVDALKIDRSFVADLGAEGDSTEIVRAIVRLAATLELGVVAEGVETESQYEALLDLGEELPREALHMQGFLFGRPVPVERMSELLAATRASAVDTIVDGSGLAGLAAALLARRPNSTRPVDRAGGSVGVAPGSAGGR